MKNSTLTISRKDARTITVNVDRNVYAAVGECLNSYTFKDIEEQVGKAVSNLVTSLFVDIQEGVVSEGRAELTDDVAVSDPTLHAGFFAPKADCIVYRMTVDVICDSHDLPDMAEAIEETKAYFLQMGE